MTYSEVATVQKSIRIALLQLAWSGDRASMQTQYRTLIDEAVKRKASLICLPEFSLLPYFPGTRDKRGFDWAEPVPGGPSERFFSDLAREYGVTIVGSLYEIAADGGLYDTATVHTRTGELIGITRKVHIPSGEGYHETDFFAGSDRFPVVKLDSITIATPTCYDQWFPEVARIYSLAGAELIVYPTAIGEEPDDPEFRFPARLGNCHARTRDCQWCLRGRCQPGGRRKWHSFLWQQFCV